MLSLEGIRNFFTDLSMAILEAVMVLAFTNLPFALLILQHASKQESALTKDSIFSLVSTNMQPEELLFYMAALFASVFYVYFIKNFEARGRLHSKYRTFLLWLFTIAPVAFLFLATPIYFEAKSSAAETLQSGMNNLHTLSQAFLIIALSTWFLSLLTQRRLDRSPKPPSYGSADTLYKSMKNG